MKERAERASDVAPESAAALQRIIADLTPMGPDARVRMIDTVCTFFGIRRHGINGEGQGFRQGAGHGAAPFHFTEDERAETVSTDDPSLKEFLREKAPVTDVERVACLAYFLAHYRGTPHLKTKDITGLNTEGAQRRFSNTAVAVDNASKAGYLVPSIKGCKQLSASGERFVAALPDREAAKGEMNKERSKRAGSGKRAGKR